MIERLQEQIKVVAAARKRTNTAKEVERSARRLFDEYNHAIIEKAADLLEGLVGEENLLRELTLQVYAETGNKTPAEGVGIREITKLDYDTKTAYNWAVEHSMALNLDKRGFEKIAKVSPPDFVTITKEPQATIATNLDEVCENNTTREEK